MQYIDQLDLAILAKCILFGEVEVPSLKKYVSLEINPPSSLIPLDSINRINSLKERYNFLSVDYYYQDLLDKEGIEEEVKLTFTNDGYYGAEEKEITGASLYLFDLILSVLNKDGKFNTKYEEFFNIYRYPLKKKRKYLFFIRLLKKGKWHIKSGAEGNTLGLNSGYNDCKSHYKKRKYINYIYIMEKCLSYNEEKNEYLSFINSILKVKLYIPIQKREEALEKFDSYLNQFYQEELFRKNLGTFLKHIELETRNGDVLNDLKYHEMEYNPAKYVKDNYEEFQKYIGNFKILETILFLNKQECLKINKLELTQKKYFDHEYNDYEDFYEKNSPKTLEVSYDEDDFKADQNRANIEDLIGWKCVITFKEKLEKIKKIINNEKNLSPGTLTQDQKDVIKEGCGFTVYKNGMVGYNNNFENIGKTQAYILAYMIGKNTEEIHIDDLIDYLNSTNASKAKKGTITNQYFSEINKFTSKMLGTDENVISRARDSVDKTVLKDMYEIKFPAKK